MLFGRAHQAVSDESLESPSSSGKRSRRPLRLTTNVNFDANHDAFKDIRQLLELFHQHDIPGPLLIRAQTDFSKEIGAGGQGLVRAPSDSYSRKLQQLEAVESFTVPNSRHRPWFQSARQWQGCAIKQLRSKNQKFESDAATAVSEVRSLCRAKALRRSKYVVKLTGWGISLDALESEGASPARLPFLVLERAHCDLEDFVSSDHYIRMTSAEKVMIAYEIGLGTHAIHTANMVHGDLKLSNVLLFVSRNRSRTTSDSLGASWHAKICDFGSANECPDETTQGAYTGTDTWRPPEVRNNPIVQLRCCDIFAYGLVIWSWFMGTPRSPIDDLEGEQIVQRIGEQQFYYRAQAQIVRAYGSRLDITRSEAKTPNVSLLGLSAESSSARLAYFQGLVSWTSAATGRSSTLIQFESQIVNKILGTLSIALDDVPKRRLRRPWDALSANRAVELPSQFQQSSLHRFYSNNYGDSSVATLRKIFQPFIEVRASRTITHVPVEIFQKIAITFLSKPRYRAYRKLYSYFREVLGPDPDCIEVFRHPCHGCCPELSKKGTELLSCLIDRHEHILDPSLSTWTTPLLSTSRDPRWTQSDHDIMYALARIRSRFVDDCCWSNLFARDNALERTVSPAVVVDQYLDRLRKCSCDTSIAWAFRNFTALSVPDDQQPEYFTFLDACYELLTDDDMTFRLQVLLERGFFLGQRYSCDPNSQSVFLQYLHSLQRAESALQLCKHFRRIASSDGIHDHCKYWYTGISNGSSHNLALNEFTTCLHDAVSALNPFVVEYLAITNFDLTAVDASGRTALDLAQEKRRYDRYRSDTLRKIIDILTRRSPHAMKDLDLPLGWEPWHLSPSVTAYVESSTKFESTDDGLDEAPDGQETTSHHLPITFTKPTAGLWQNRLITLVERKVSESEYEPFFFNPLRFLRFSDEIEADIRPAKEAVLSETWYQLDVANNRRWSFGLNWKVSRLVFEGTTFIERKMTFDGVQLLTYESAWVQKIVLLWPLRLPYILSVEFLLCGGILLPLIPFALGAESAGWAPRTQFWLSSFGLTAVYAQVWYKVDRSAFKRRPGNVIGPGLPIRSPEIDRVCASTTMFLDVIVCIFFLVYGRQMLAVNFVVGSILINNLLALGSAVVCAGIRYHESTWNTTMFIEMSGFTVFVHCLIYALSLLPFSSVSGKALVSRGSAITSLVVAACYQMFRMRTHAALLNDYEDVDVYEEDEYEFAMGQNNIRQEEKDPPFHTLSALSFFFLLGALLARSLTRSLRLAGPNSAISPLLFSAHFDMLVLQPVIIKCLIVMKICVYGAYNRMNTVLMRTVGSSLNLGLAVFPLLVVIEWIRSGDLDFNLGTTTTVLLLIQLLLLWRALFRGVTEFLTGACLIFIYVLMAFSQSVYRV